MQFPCPLCQQPSEKYYADKYFRCLNCLGIFVAPPFLPDKTDEKKRYDFHQYDANDLGYKKFVSPLIESILKNHSKNQTILDFGSGPQSIITEILTTNGYTVNEFDPFYKNEIANLKQTYDIVIACEVIEHFHQPKAELERFQTMLNPKGTIYLMTHMFNKEIDFEKWYYKNDFTHVFFYSKKTFEYIAKKYNFNINFLSERLIKLENR